MVISLVLNEDYFVMVKRIVLMVQMKILVITITILIAHRLVIQPCAFYPTASAPKTAPEYQTTCRPKKSLR